MKFRSRLQEPMVRLMGALCLLACTCGGEAETVRAPTGAITLESESCTLIVPPATARPTETGSTELPVRLCPQMQVLYLNFDGQTVVGAATDDLANSRSTIVGSLLGNGQRATLPPYDGGPVRRAEILSRVRAHFATISIDVVDQRPADSDYSMLVVGGRPDAVRTDGKRVSGVAPLDCFNDSSIGIGFVFAEEIGSTNAIQIAQTIAHEAAHMFGLLHVTVARDHMYRATVLNPLTQAFRDEAFQTDNTTGACDRRSTQNSFRHLQTHLVHCVGTAIDAAVPLPTVDAGAAPPGFDAAGNDEPMTGLRDGGDSAPSEPEPGKGQDDDPDREAIERSASDSGRTCLASFGPTRRPNGFFVGTLLLASWLFRRRLRR